ncbi:transposase [Streptomyces wedmorensis]|uniref:Transposase n=1 Tax=Streptomyces wedmorensis TaxID=43759 RepID=A0ABW6ILU0_STRWE
MQLTDAEREFIGSHLPIGAYGPYPERLRQQFEGVIWRFRTGGQWREMSQELRAWSTVHNRFRQWSDAGVFEALLEGLIAEAAKRGEVDLSLVGIDSTTARAHHDAAGMRLGHDVVTAPEKAAAEEKIRPRASRTVEPDVADEIQRAIMRMLVDEHADEAIAWRLGSGRRTVTAHVSRIAATLQSRSRAQLGRLIAIMSCCPWTTRPRQPARRRRPRRW